MMKQNVGLFDKTIRISAALIIGGLYFGGKISGVTAIVLLVVAIVFLLTSMLNFCPLYLPFGLSTRRQKK